MKHRTCMYVILALLFAILAGAMAVALAGCAAGTTGLTRPIDDQVYQSLTNGITIGAHAGSTILPTPWSTIFEAAGGASLTLLAAWQTMTHRTAQRNKAAIAALNSDPKV